LYPGSDRIKTLTPDVIIDFIDIEATDEVIIRRFVSAMYMALFNYWCAIEYKNNPGKHKLGKSKQNDDFTYIEFEKCMAVKARNEDIETLSAYRIACDHRINNPAEVRFSDKLTVKLSINNQSLRIVYNSFQNLLKTLQ
jgi:hypothetical protein